jgi:hypothetical protein
LSWASSAQRAIEVSAAAPVLCAMFLVFLPLWQLATNRFAADATVDMRATSYVNQALAVLPPQSVIITGSDDHTFALSYAAATVRPDIVVVDRDLAQFDWYRRHVAEAIGVAGSQLAALDDGSFLLGLVQSAARGRAILLADEDDALQQMFTWTPDGLFQRLSSTAR